MEYNAGFQSERTSVIESVSKIHVGILGGGQLAKMLCEAAYPWGLVPVVYAADAADPAARISPCVVVGPLDDEAGLDEFMGRIDVAVFENEFVDCTLLERVAKRHPKVVFRPGLAAMEAVRDKADQKALLNRLGIPTAAHVIMPPGDATAWIAACTIKFGSQFVVKLGRMGYDGKGVFFHLGSRDMSAAVAFVEEAVKRGLRVYAESFSRFARELAVVACRGLDGSFIAWPLVVSEQEEGICARVLGPATSMGVSPTRELEAHAYARKIAESIQLVGCFAVELFEGRDGTVSVNELAPRVHNSGHYTQDASATSQFENHWRAVLGLPLGATHCTPAFAMENLLGPAGAKPDAAPPVPPPEGHLHWYGKESRPRRKVGHMNAVGAVPGDIHALRESLIGCRDRWERSFGGK